jgi:hypothetical protein
MENKKVKQMICEICKDKMERSSSTHVFDFAFIDRKLVLWVDRVGAYVVAPRFGTVSLTGDQLRGVK